VLSAGAGQISRVAGLPFDSRSALAQDTHHNKAGLSFDSRVALAQDRFRGL